jgi:hypothetical protein
MSFCVHNWWKEYILLNTVSVKTYWSSVIHFPHCEISIHTSVGTWFGILRVVKIHNVFSVRTPYSLVPGYECFGGSFWVYLHRMSEDGHSMPSPKPQYPPVRLHGPITQKTIILNLNILHCQCILLLHYLLQTKYMY